MLLVKPNLIYFGFCTLVNSSPYKFAFQCSFFGDCCIDAEANPELDPESDDGSFECVNVKTQGDLYFRSKCPETWQDPEVRRQCEQPDLVSDPMGSLPVTNVENGLTYRNQFCSLCNQDQGEKQVT